MIWWGNSMLNLMQKADIAMTAILTFEVCYIWKENQAEFSLHGCCSIKSTVTTVRSQWIGTSKIHKTLFKPWVLQTLFFWTYTGALLVYDIFMVKIIKHDVLILVFKFQFHSETLPW